MDTILETEDTVGAPLTAGTLGHDIYLEATGRRRSSDHGATLTTDTDSFIIGQRVWVGGLRPGQIAYIGETHFAPGEWAGIVLDEPNGKNDGCVAGKRYFQCEPKKGIFSRLTRLTHQPIQSSLSKESSPIHSSSANKVKASPERSRTVSPTSSIYSAIQRNSGKHGMTVGDRVIVSSGFGSRPGILKYLGETKFAQGNWCGVQLDEPTGKNDGSVDGVKYFECPPKYGIFVPIAKVSLSPSSKKTRISRAGSRESLISVGTLNSVATTNTSQMRVNAQKLSTPPKTTTTLRSNFSLQDVIREKQNHIEQLMIERDLDREDAQNQALTFQKTISELKGRIGDLEKLLIEEKKKTEDLQYSIDEATFCGDELSVQTQVYKEKIIQLEKQIEELTSASSKDNASKLEAEQNQIKEYQNEIQEIKEKHEKELSTLLEQRLRLEEEVKYLLNRIQDLEKELVSKDEHSEKLYLTVKEMEMQNVKLLEKIECESGKFENQNLKGIIETMKNEMSNLQKKLEEIQNENNQLKIEISNKDAQINALSGELTNTKQSLENKNKEINQVNADLDKTKKDFNEINNEYDKIKSLITDSSPISDVIVKYQNQLKEIQAEKTTLEETLKDKQSLVNNLEKTLAEQENNLKQHLLKITDIELNLKSKDEEYIALQKQTEELSKEYDEFKKKYESEHNEIGKLQQDYKNISQNYEDLNKKHSEECLKSEQLLKEIADLKNSSQDLSSQVTKLNQTLTEKDSKHEEMLNKTNLIKTQLENDLESSKQNIAQANEEINLLKVKLNHLTNENKSLTAQIEALTIKSQSEINESVQIERQRIEILEKNCKEYTNRNLELEVLVSKLQTETQTLQSKLDSQENEFKTKEQSLTTQINELDSKSKDLSCTLEDLNKKLSSQEQLEKEMGVVVENLKTEISVKEKDLQDLKTQIDNTNRVIKELKVKLEQSENSFNEMRKLNTELSSELDSMKSSNDNAKIELQRIEVLENNCKEYLGKNSELETSVSKLQAEIIALQTENNSQGNQFKTKEESLKAQITELNNKNKDLASSLEDLNKKLLYGEKVEKEIGVIVENFKTEISSKENELHGLKTQVDEANAAINDLKAKIEKSNNSYDEVKKLSESLTSELTSMKSVNAEKDKQIENLMSQIKKQEEDIIDLVVENHDLLSKESLIENKENFTLNDIKTLIVENKKENTILKTELASKQEELLSIINELNKLKDSIETKAVEDTKSSQQQSDNKDNVEKLSLENYEKEKIDNKQKSEKEKIDESVLLAQQQYQNTIVELEKKIVEQQSNINILNKKLDHVQMENNFKTQEINSLKEKLNSGENQNNHNLDKIDENDPMAHINFLNSIIADMQKKNDALVTKVNTLESLASDVNLSSVFNLVPRRKPAPRVFCDICDEFDLHETEDCPLQCSDSFPSSPHNGGNKEKPPPRKYCEKCEEFGHEVDECQNETY